MAGGPAGVAAALLVALLARLVRRARLVTVARGAPSAVALPAPDWRWRPGPSPGRPGRSGAARESALLADLGALRAAVAAGGSVLTAFEVIAGGDGPWSAGAAEVAAAARRGGPVQDAIDAWASASGEAAVALVADGLAIAGASGGSQARVLAAVAESVAERQALSREVRALSSQARASAAVLVATPMLFMVAVAILDPRVAAYLLGTPAGVATIVLGLALDAAGAAWMAVLIGRAS